MLMPSPLYGELQLNFTGIMIAQEPGYTREENRHDFVKMAQLFDEKINSAFTEYPCRTFLYIIAQKYVNRA